MCVCVCVCACVRVCVCSFICCIEFFFSCVFLQTCICMNAKCPSENSECTNELQKLEQRELLCSQNSSAPTTDSFSLSFSPLLPFPLSNQTVFICVQSIFLIYIIMFIHQSLLTCHGCSHFHIESRFLLWSVHGVLSVYILSLIHI